MTHDQAEALSFADQVAVMRGGKLAQIGNPFVVYTRPADRATAEFLGDAVILDAWMEGSLATCSLGGDAGSQSLRTWLVAFPPRLDSALTDVTC